MSTPRLVNMAVTLAIALSAAVSPAGAAGATPPPREDCQAGTSTDAKAAADRIMERHLVLGTYPEVTLAADPTWREAPFGGDRNWLFNYHALRWVVPLLQAGRETGQTAYTNRAAFLIRDWLETNPRSAPANAMAWNDHAAAWRASVLACAVGDLGKPRWLAAGLASHGSALADPTFYVKHGNHALNQAIGLLDVACLVDDSTWRSLAATRLAALVLESVDTEGATIEQAIEYQLYNYRNYQRARRHLTACSQAVPAAFGRVARMPELLAYATAPDGKYEQIGDSDLGLAFPIQGTPAEFAATSGQSGPRPSATIKRFAAGYLFARSGWGETRPFDRETFISLRFGPGRVAHGHADGGSLTLVANGQRLLIDPGKYTYTAGGWRNWFVGRTAHNVVTVDGLHYDASRSTMLSTKTRPEFLLAALSNSGYAGVTARRRVMWSRAADYLIVDDALTASVARTFRQTWHLAAGASPIVVGNRLDTRQGDSNLAIVQLVGHPTSRIVSGRRDPIQGWRSTRYGANVSAPVLESTLRGTSVRYLTLLVPYRGARPTISGHIVRLTRDGYVVDVTIGTHKERVTVGGTSTSIVPRS